MSQSSRFQKACWNLNLMRAENSHLQLQLFDGFGRGFLIQIDHSFQSLCPLRMTLITATCVSTPLTLRFLDEHTSLCAGRSAFTCFWLYMIRLVSSWMIHCDTSMFAQKSLESLRVVLYRFNSSRFHLQTIGTMFSVHTFMHWTHLTGDVSLLLQVAVHGCLPSGPGWANQALCLSPAIHLQFVSRSLEQISKHVGHLSKCAPA